jgi:hypothetical protein
MVYIPRLNLAFSEDCVEFIEDIPAKNDGYIHQYSPERVCLRDKVS